MRAQTLIRPMTGDLETRGVRRGTRYYLAGEAPPEEPEETFDEAGGLPEQEGTGRLQ